MLHSERLFSRAAAALADAARDAVKASLDLFTVMIPVIVVVKVLQELDLIRPLARPLEPLMRLVGLPAEMGLVWAASLLNGIYAAVMVFLQLLQQEGGSLSVAQTTTLATLMLIAHALPVECGIARKCGARFPVQALIRVGAALLFGVIWNGATGVLGVLKEPAAVSPALLGAHETAGWTAWLLGEARQLLAVVLIIFSLMVMMKVLKALGILERISRAMAPVMRMIGVGERASTITMIGITLGISYGSGLIIRDARSGEMSPEEVFSALSFMGICHSLIEDTLLMMTLGASVWGMLGLRVPLCLGLTALLVRLLTRLPETTKGRFLWVKRP